MSSLVIGELLSETVRHKSLCAVSYSLMWYQVQFVHAYLGQITEHKHNSCCDPEYDVLARIDTSSACDAGKGRVGVRFLNEIYKINDENLITRSADFPPFLFQYLVPCLSSSSSPAYFSLFLSTLNQEVQPPAPPPPPRMPRQAGRHSFDNYSPVAFSLQHSGTQPI
jgi:hypothetical protein